MEVNIPMVFKNCTRCKIDKLPQGFGFKSFDKRSRQGTKSTRTYCLRCKSAMDSEIQKLQRVTIRKLVNSIDSYALINVRNFYIEEKIKILTFKKGAK